MPGNGRLIQGPTACTMDDAGLAVCLLSTPFQQEREFFKFEFEDALFKGYRDAVAKNLRASDVEKAAYRELFYKPTPYYLFGRFDLAVITLIDDHEFASRTFHPFDPMMAVGEKTYFENFLHKVVTGPTPALGDSSIIDLAHRTFLAHDRKPLFGLSFLKLNNSLLVGAGAKFLHATIVRAQQLASRHKAEGLDVIVLQSYAWHELTLVMFSTSYDAIVKFLVEIRELSVRDLSDPSLEGSLLHDCIASSPRSAAQLAEAHLFADSETTLGFDASILTDDGSGAAKIDSGDRIELFSRWFVKPGHLSQAGKLLAGRDLNSLKMTLGRGDLVEPQLPSASTKAQLTRYLHRFGETALHNIMLNRYTVAMSPSVPWSELPEPTNDHPAFTDRIRNLRVPIERIKELEVELRSCGTPKILALRVLNMFANFNDGLLDRNLYAFFWELQPFMDDVLAHVRQATGGYDGGVAEWCSELQRITQNFELAYRNRFHNSHRLGEITDFNVDFKGGIQQLVAAFDGAFKAVASVVGNDHSFVSVSGESGVFSTTYETRLNYFHVFQPEIFLTVAAHEASWCCLRGTPTMMSATHKRELRDIERLLVDVTASMTETWKELENDGLVGSLDPLQGQRPEERFLQTVFVDRLSFSLTYNRDTDLFWYWYLGYFHQLPHAYESPLIVSKSQLSDFVLRLAIVSDVTQAEDMARRLAPFDSGKGHTSRLDGLQGAVARLSDSPLFGEFRERAWRFADELLLATTQDGGDQSPATTWVSLEARVASTASLYRERLEAGEVVTFSGTGPFAPFRFCQSLFFAYLSLVKDRFGVPLQGARSALLFRDVKDGGRAKPRADTSGFAFDPHGGTFTTGPSTRRQLFRWRSALTMSLWDMAFKVKRSSLSDRLRSVAP